MSHCHRTTQSPHFTIRSTGSKTFHKKNSHTRKLTEVIQIGWFIHYAILINRFRLRVELIGLRGIPSFLLKWCFISTCLVLKFPRSLQGEIQVVRFGQSPSWQCHILIHLELVITRISRNGFLALQRFIYH